MTVDVLYFAAVRDLLGAERESLPLPQDTTVAGLARDLARRHPQLAPHLGAVRFAVNEVFENAACVLRGGDVVALIPPVAGGAT